MGVPDDFPDYSMFTISSMVRGRNKQFILGYFEWNPQFFSEKDWIEFWDYLMEYLGIEFR